MRARLSSSRWRSWSVVVATGATIAGLVLIAAYSFASGEAREVFGYLLFLFGLPLSLVLWLFPADRVPDSVLLVTWFGLFFAQWYAVAGLLWWAAGKSEDGAS